MRKGPGESRVKGVFGQGGSVRVCGESESWVRVEWGKEGTHTHTHIYRHTLCREVQRHVQLLI